MRTALRFTLGSAFTFLALGCAFAHGAPAPPNYQGLWWNSPPGSEPGWGLQVAHQGDRLLATWLAYGPAGEAKWLELDARRIAEGTYHGRLVETRGPPAGLVPYDPLLFTRYDVGEGTLSFRDGAEGTFRYRFSATGLEATKAITRQAFGALPTCAYAAQPGFANATNYTDRWQFAGGGEDAWGVHLAHQGDVVFATWFTHDAHRLPAWYFAVAPRIATGVYGGMLLRASGPPAGAGPYDPARVSTTPVGTATLTFAHGNAATFAWTLEGLSRTRPLSRALLAPPAGTHCRTEVADAIAGTVIDPFPARVIVCADADGNGRCGPGETQALTDDDGRYVLPMAAPFDGPLAAEVIAGQARAAGASGALAGRTHRLASPGREYSVHLSPFTTLVRLAGDRDLRLAEERVRDELGVPARFALRLGAPAAEGSHAQALVRTLATALQEADGLDYADPGTLPRVVAAFPPVLTELPQLRIETKNAAPVVSKDDYVDATFTISYPGAWRAPAVLAGKIRGRGNTTWIMEKKPYKVQFANDAAYAGLDDVLGLRKNRNWALLADYLDRTLMRNKLAFTLGNSALFADGLKWTPSGQHLEAWLNGDYVGVYLLAEDIRIDPARLDIRKMSAKPEAGECEGGYIVEVDVPLDCPNDGTVNLQLETPVDVHICIDTPDEDAITPRQLAWIKSHLVEVEGEIYAGRTGKINPASFADWYLVNELFRNQDATFYSSDFMWKDAGSAANPADRLLNMGPLWDFDITAGNTDQYEGWKPEGCWVNQSRDERANWYTALFDNGDFLELTLARWKDRRASLATRIDTSLSALDRRLAAPRERNLERWPLLRGRLPMDRQEITTAAGHVAYLRGFLAQRMAWLDRAFESPAAFAAMCR